MKVLLYQFHLQKEGLVFAPSESGDDNYGEYWKLSSESCKRYAEKWGWDYFFDNPTEEEWEPPFIPEPQFHQTFTPLKLLRNYDAIVKVDSDILIKPESPNVVKKYRGDGTNFVVNTPIGNVLEKISWGRTSINSGVIIYYKESLNTKDMLGLTPSQDYTHKGIYMLCDYIKETRNNKRWWEDLEDFKPFLMKFPSGMYNDERLLSFLINLYSLPMSHLHFRFNFLLSDGNIKNILSDEAYFIHYVGSKKKYMEQHYNLIMG